MNETMVLAELKRLIPYSNVTLTTKYENITVYPGLQSVVSRATTNVEDRTVNATIVDARLVYDWLSTNGEGHITEFIDPIQTSQQLDIPAFIFAFSGNYNFGFTFKEEVFLEEHPGTIYGVALGDLVPASRRRVMTSFRLPAMRCMDRPKASSSPRGRTSRMPALTSSTFGLVSAGR